MAVDKNSIRKGQTTGTMVFDYKPREFTMKLSAAAVDYVSSDESRKHDFRISELAAQQSGVSALEDERSQTIINEQVLVRLKDVEERGYKEAYELGYKEGFEKALQDHKAEIAMRLSGLDSLLASIESLKSTLILENEAQFV